MTSIKNVVIAGVTGNLGPELAEALLATGKFKVSALKRASSTAPIVDGVKVIDVDYDSPESLVKALQGQDAVISNLNPVALDAQKALIDAALKTGVKRFVPSEFGSDLDDDFFKSLPVFGYKVQIQEYLKSKTPGTDLSYTFVYNGVFLDWGIKVGFLVDSKNSRATVYDGGKKLLAATTLRSVGTGVAGILLHPEETKNRAVRITSANVSQSELIELGEKAAGKKFEVTDLEGEKVLQESYAALKNGDYSEGVMYGFLKGGIMGGNHPAVFKTNDNELLGVPQLSKEDVAAIVAKYI